MLDLGTRSVLKVKIEGEAYDLHAPTVSQTEKFQKELKGQEDDQMGAFMSLLEELGLPKTITQKLDVVQVRKLSDGLLGMVEKK